MNMNAVEIEDIISSYIFLNRAAKVKYLNTRNTTVKEG